LPDARLIAYRRGGRLRRIRVGRGQARPIAFDAPGIDFLGACQAAPR